MKKIFSLFLSLILIFSMTVSNVVFVEAAVSEQRELVEIKYDTVGKTLGTASGSVSYYKHITSTPTNGSAETISAIRTARALIAVDTDGSLKCARQNASGAKDVYINYYPNNEQTAVSTGKYVISGQFHVNKAKTDGSGLADLDQNKVELKGADVSLNVTNLKANVWYDYSYIVDLDSDAPTFKVQYKEIGSDGFTVDSSTDITTKKFSYIRADVDISDSYTAVADALNYVNYKNFKMIRKLGVAESSIRSVNDDNEVPARTKNLTFTMSEDIATLSDGDITATPVGGGAVNTATSWTVTSDNDPIDPTYTVNATFAQRFTENLTYDLAINPDVYAGYKAMGADGSITDVDTSGLAAQFTVGDYTIDTTTGTGVLYKGIYDAVGKPFTGFAAGTLSGNKRPVYQESPGNEVTITEVRVFNTVRGIVGDAIAIQRSGTSDWYVGYDNPLDVTTKGVYTISGKFFTNKAKADGVTADLSSGTIGINRSDGKYDASHNVKDLLKSSTWYQYTYEVDLAAYPNEFTVEYTADGDTVPTYSDTKFFTTGKFSSIRADVEVDDGYTSFDSNGNYVLYKDLKMEYHIDKSKIISVNSDAVVAPNQNELVFTISNPIPGLDTNPGWVVVEDASGNENAATAVTVTGTASPYTVTATLTENLAAWSDYTLKLSEDIYAGYGELNADGDLIDPVIMPDSDYTKVFSVASTGFDMREKTITSDADSVDYLMEYTNASSSCPPVTLLLPVFSADGIMQNMEAVTLSDLPINGATKEASISASFAAGQGAKMFAINGWAGKEPYFGKSWNVDAATETLEAFSSAEPITIGAFDYDNFKVNVGVVASDGQVSGVLYVYDSTATLSDSVKPIYANYITTAADGTFKMDIPFKDTIDDSTGTYKVEFYAPGITPVSGTFTVYDEADIQAQKEAAILLAAQNATTVAALKQAILGINDIEQVVNDNFEVFDIQADTTVYNSLSNKDAVFSKMFDQKSVITNYTNLVLLFQNCAIDQQNAENYVVINPSTDNSSYGGSSVAVKDTPAVKPVVPTQPEGGAVADPYGFADMQGHWASEFATELSNRGIMNGYPDGSFKGEGSITRAELAKTLVVAMEIALGTGSSFGDVSENSWHAPYIAGASAAGVITGFENGTFAPDAPVTRQDAALMLYRAMKLKRELPVGYTFFTDDFDIQDYASDAIRCLGDLGIVKGDANTRFNPLNDITRAEVATIICRALDYIESH